MKTLHCVKLLALQIIVTLSVVFAEPIMLSVIMVSVVAPTYELARVKHLTMPNSMEKHLVSIASIKPAEKKCPKTNAPTYFDVVSPW